MRELDDRENSQRRVLRRYRPARGRAQCRDHHQHRRLQGESRRQREQHDLGNHAQDPQNCNRQSVEPRLLPGDRCENVIGGMAALDQRRRHDNSDKAAVAQQRACAAGARAGGPGVVQRLQREAGQRPECGGACDDPDQISGGDQVEQRPADQCAEDEGGRTPQPQRSVIEAIAFHAPQRVGICQRHHGRPQAARQGVDQEHQHRQMLGAQDEKAQGGGKGGHDDAAAQGLAPFRKARHQR